MKLMGTSTPTEIDPLEEKYLNILKTVTEPALRTSVDTKAVSNAIRRTVQEAEADKSSALRKRAVDVGIAVAGNLQPKLNQEKTYGWK
jgi:hypothetical protein